MLVVCVILTPRKDNQIQWWFNLGGWVFWGSVTVVLIWVGSEISTISHLIRLATQETDTGCLKKDHLFFWSRANLCWFSFPLLTSLYCCFIWKRGVGLVQVWATWRHEHKWKYQPYQYSTSIQKWMPLVAEPYPSSAIVVSWLCYSLRLWTFAAAVEIVETQHYVAFPPLVISAAYQLVLFPSLPSTPL